jgi:hypothetical protein
VLADGFSQTLLHTSIAQAGLIAKLAQEAGVPTEDPVLVQRVLENFVNTHGVQALAHLLHEHVQLGYCCRTAYQFDPTFAPGTQVTRAVQNSDGSTALTVVPQLAMQATPGEDQNLTLVCITQTWRALPTLRASCDGTAKTERMRSTPALT